MAGRTDGARVFRVRKPRARLHCVWMRLLAPFHHLAKADEAFAAALLDRRAGLAAEGRVGELLSREGRRLLAEATGASEVSVNVHIHKLRKAGVLGERDFNPLFVPEPGEGGLSLTFKIEFDGD